MPKVVFKMNNYENELKRIERSIAEVDFYINNNYCLSWPSISDQQKERIKNKELTVKDLDNIKKILKHEIKFDKYINDYKKITTKWKIKERDFFKKAEEVLKISPIKEYNCSFTRYGVGGSYHPPHIIVINIATCKSPVKTVAHEIIHLMIHDLIEDNKINHWSKERLVDLYTSDIYGDDNFQKIKDENIIKRVDKIYKKFKSLGAEKLIENL